MLIKERVNPNRIFIIMRDLLFVILSNLYSETPIINNRLHLANNYQSSNTLRLAFACMVSCVNQGTSVSSYNCYK
jgi:hypothetical protein